MLTPSPEIGDAYLGATQDDTYWIGMAFPPETSVPDGYEYVDNPEMKYAIFRFDGKNDNELLSEDGIGLVLNEINKHALTPRDRGLCIERYSRPNSPDGKGKALLECLFPIQ